MQLMQAGILPVSSDLELIKKHLPLNDARILELGCGTAFTTRRIVENFPSTTIVAAEVDRIQHQKNLSLTDLPTVTFKLAGMQDTAEPDNSFDAVIMLKSLHHVPVELMSKGFTEIHRVLKPGGIAYISEPVFAGAFNEILRLFNDEEQVRLAAFNAIRQAVESGLFSLQDEIHFISQSRFQGFGEFEDRILNATHSEFNIDASLLSRIRQLFEQHLNQHGLAVFENPMRADVLRKI